MFLQDKDNRSKTSVTNNAFKKKHFPGLPAVKKKTTTKKKKQKQIILLPPTFISRFLLLA